MAKEVEIIVSAKDNASWTMKKVGDSSKSMADKLKANLNTIRIASWLAFAGLVAVGKKFLDAGMEAIEAETKLTTVLKKRTQATDAQVKSILDLATAQQKVWVIEDDMIVAWAGQLATFVKTTKSIETLIPAMNNLVAQQSWVNATSWDMVNVANMLWKAMSGNIGILGRYGIMVTDAQKKTFEFWTEQQRATLLAELLNNKVWNMNETLAETFQWRMQQLKNTLGNVGETIWIAMIPALQKLVEAVMPVITKVTDWINANPELTAKILMVTTAVAGLVLWLSLALPAIVSIISAMTMLAWPVGIVVWLIAWLTYWAYALWEALNPQVFTLQELNAQLASTNYEMDMLEVAFMNWEISAEKYRKKMQELKEEQARLNSMILIMNTSLWQQIQILANLQKSQIWTSFWGLWSITWTLQNSASKIKGKASWWPVSSGTPYMVGEQWPELFVPKQSWNIVPNNSKSTSSININMASVVVREQADIEAIANALARKIELKRNFSISY